MREDSEDHDDKLPQTKFTQINPEGMDLQPMDTPTDEEDGLHTVKSESPSDQAMYKPAFDIPLTPSLEDIAGLNPFSSTGSESECSSTHGRVTPEVWSADASESRARMTDGESYFPSHPPKASKRETKTD